MKKLLPLLLLILIGCSKEPINMDEVLIERNDVYYTKDTNQPYSGPVFRLHKNGIIGQEVNLKNGKPDGLWKSYSMEGDNFYSLIEYKDGEVISIKRFEYYGWGPLFEEMTFNSFDDMDFFQKGRTGSYYYKRYYDNGQLERQGTYKDGKLDGLWESYKENGELEQEITYKDDLIWEGSLKTYNDNGEVEYESTYKDGEPWNGTFKYYSNKELVSEGIYKDGKMEGLWKWYYITSNGRYKGQLMSEGTWKDGKPDGPVKTYHDNGQFRTEENYKDGKEDGLWKVYDINGQLEEERTYKDGELIDVKEY